VDEHRCERCRRTIFGMPDAAYCESCSEIMAEEDEEEECQCCGNTAYDNSLYCPQCENGDCPDCGEEG
jgi:hypothetical protein